MSIKPYGLICPITKACEILEPRWTIPILAELWCGSTRFNDIRRGVGHISPGLLSKRLKELEALGLVERVEDRAQGTVDYFRTPMAIALEPALNALANWSQEYVKAETVVSGVDVETLMWKMREHIDPALLPRKRVVIRFHFNDEGLEYDTYWALIHEEGTIEICTEIPDFDVHLYVETTSPSLTAILLARTSIERELESERLYLSGDAKLARTMPDWLIQTEYMCENRLAYRAAG
ncbi:helix-turn-helix domain-containing protein [Celeribacter sp. PS-C1]|uniref:winged helix-turn-helix transcriptional regulator n=1 Tax=Celeribacter sp. PS-C1 TaxID=2820813 RepID=UPI001C686D0E|nr:helix-turn-helix domain-containing protein [Celeribacter sp. PS-C1]MBW6418865.1 helix-turn-helix transcriptional regulator [Celeribacter sp. PS-C1]